jgi:cytochrome P450
MHRIVKTPLTLSDGLHLPEGVHICFPSGPISKDPNFILNPDIFDGFRWCQDPGDRDALRQSSIALNSNAEMDKEEQNGTLLPAPSPITSFISISPSSMHFGFGRQACPGWFLAASTIKAIMSRIIMDYEFKFEGDRVGWRPANIGIGEHIVPNTNTRVLFRKRQK